ncbi:MAG: hypothetical protein WKG01_32405 [Kofleriaceae bacterium]
MSEDPPGGDGGDGPALPDVAGPEGEQRRKRRRRRRRAGEGDASAAAPAGDAQAATAEVPQREAAAGDRGAPDVHPPPPPGGPDAIHTREDPNARGERTGRRRRGRDREAPAGDAAPETPRDGGRRARVRRTVRW